MSALRRLTRLGRDRRGTALMEFAFALPVLIILFLGSYQMSDAIACKRRVTIMTRAIGDMTSQYREISGTDLDTLMGASTQILA
ncbi:MAG TPA: pilus assembly protein, partial [Sphingomonas sp.]|nr:pilus assembly protein [Sphingomonas sp.]